MKHTVYSYLLRTCVWPRRLNQSAVPYIYLLLLYFLLQFLRGHAKLGSRAAEAEAAANGLFFSFIVLVDFQLSSEGESHVRR